MCNTNKLLEIIQYFAPEELSLDEIDLIDKTLFMIMSHSKQAISFVSHIEDEFDIEIGDEEVCLDNFLSFEKLYSLIQKYVLLAQNKFPR
ncbi:MAG: hypothetical protein AB2L24_20590 [Mangrovibacterium sp.]